jgi:RHS repeat-associated protein
LYIIDPRLQVYSYQQLWNINNYLTLSQYQINTTGTVQLLVKTNGTVVAERTITINNGVVNQEYFAIQANRGEQLSFELVANPAQLANLLSKKEAAVYSAPTQQSILSPQFTQWSIPEEIIYRQNWPIASAIDSIKKEANISVTLKQPAGQPKGKKDLKMSKGQVEEESFVLQPQAGDEMVIGADIDSAAAKMSQQVIAVLFNPYTSQHNTITEATQWTVPATGNYTVNSQLIANSATNGSVLLTLKKAGNMIDQADIVITDGIVSNVSFDILANKGDVLQFELTPSNASLMSQFSQTVLEVMVPKVIGYSMPVEFHSATTSQLVGQPYRGWSVFGYNGNKEAAELPIQITAADLTADGLRTSVTELQTAMANGTLEQDFDPNKLQLKLLPFFPQLETQRWNGPDNNAWVQATQQSSSRKGRDSIVVPKIDDFVNCRVPKKLRISRGKSFSQAEVTGATTESETVTSIDYMDMNGDGFPDLVVNYGIQNTKMTGGLETSRRQIDGLKHVSQSGATATNSEAANFSQANGDRIQTEMPSLGTSGKLLEGGTKKVLQLRDINADGLPDRLTYTDNQLWVEWGLGYRFTEPELFGAANPTTQHQGEVIDDPTKTNYNSGPYSRAAGQSQARYTAASTGQLLDINGDGLLDWVTVDHNDPTVFKVALNTGNGFLAQILWPSSLKQGLSTESSQVNGEGRYNTNGMGMNNAVSRDYLLINQGNYSNQDINRTEVLFTDFDGDGYVDSLLANQEDQPISMGRNPIGRTNLLKRVHRPLGASLEVQYQRRGNAYQQPFSRWVLSRVEVNDGHPGDGIDVQATTYQYDQCQFQRQERELYGSQQVIEERRDLSQGDKVYRTLTRLFHNNSFYSQGLLQKEILADANGNKYLETEHSYQLQDIDTNQALVNIEHLTATVFPQLRRTDKRFYEGEPNPGKSTSIYYKYDSWGNISNTNDQAELGTPNDDVVTSYEYFQDIAHYIVGKPNRITIKGGNMVMRRRESELELGTGNIKQFRQYLAGGEAAITDFEHDQYGNVIRLTGPANHKGQRYSLVYTYDGQVHTHKVSTTDSFGYTSTANYNLKYAQVENTTDINNNSLDYTYDQFGRIATLVGPYQTGTGQYTASYEYHPEAQVPWALSQYIDVYRNDPIETVQFSDGLKRIVQTKKDATSASNAQDVMIVSGHLTFDFVGRTVEQYYPITEPLGSQGVFNSGVDSVQPTRMVYDVLDRNTSTTIPDNTSTLTEYGFGYDREGQTQFLTIVTDANSNSKETYRDVRDLITTVQQFNNGDSGRETILTSYEYDPMKQIVRVMDDHRNQTTASYDHFGRRIQFNSPDMGLIKTDYDLASNVIRKITPNLLAEGQAIVYDYDYNRLNSISYPNYSGNNVNYTYGAPGAAQNRANRIVMVSDQSGSEERFYGPLGETVKTIKTIASKTQGNSANSAEVYTTEYVYDTWGLLQSLTYPDGEVLTHQYNAGGLLSAAFGDKDGHHYSYIKQMGYDKFEKRVFVELGNQVRSHYSYNPLNRRLATLKTGIGTGNLFQDLSYQYDPVGNITGLANLAAVTSSNEKGGATQYQYQYDDLYRLIHAEGTFEYKQTKQHRYQLDMSYDSIHNIMTKNQQHQISQASGNETPQKKTSYDWQYEYSNRQPHAPSQIGERAFSYDANGNLTGWLSDSNNNRRAIVWDEENRIQSISDNGHTMTYKYNDVGRRVMKKGPQGETVYVNSYFTIRNRQVGTKHIYAGNIRMVSKMMKQGNKTPLEKDLYFYHPDHLGSSAYVTDAQGGIYQHLEYFPFGDTFVEQVSNTQRTPYWFTAKELDEETGLYYVEARYYDPRTSVWLSTDPILDDYLDGSPNNGVFEPMNLGLFTYVANSPVMYIDPDGRCSVWYSW